MNAKRIKIILGVLGIVIGLPVALILTAFACSSIMDKTNETIVSSGVTRRYLLYVQEPTIGPSQRHWSSACTPERHGRRLKWQ